MTEYNPTPSYEEELARRRRQDAFYMASGLWHGDEKPTVADVIITAKKIEAYLKGEAE